MNKKSELLEILRISFHLAKANFRLRIEGSYLGIFWYLIKPLALFAVLLLVRAAAFQAAYIPAFPLYLLIGIAGYNFFKDAITGSIDAINTNPGYLKSINNIKPESLVLAVIIQNIFSHGFEFMMIGALAIYLQVPLFGLLLYPLLLLIFALLTLGISLIFATIGAYISDLDNIWVIVSQLMLLATPIFYIAPKGSLIYNINLFNPLFYFLEAARDLIIAGTIATNEIAVLFFLGTALLLLGGYIFGKFKKKFAELL